MKKRHIYALLFGIPGLFVAGIVAIILFGGLAGILWLYVFGDNAWPAYIELVISILFVFAVLVVWGAFIVLGYFTGKRLENDPELNRSHVLLSAGMTAIFLLLMVFQQWSAGNRGFGGESAACSQFCTQHGYSTGGRPPGGIDDGLCSCYDESGNEALRIPLDHLDPDFRR